MATKKEASTRTDAKGDVHRTFPDGRCEIYHKGLSGKPVDLDGDFMEVTDDLDTSINRRRFIPWTKTAPTAGGKLETRDEGIPGLDVDHPDKDGDTDGNEPY